MKKQKIWLTLSAVSLAAASTTAASPEKAGVAGKVNPTVEEVSTTGTRNLFVGSDIFRDETIKTDDKGQAHLLFLDQSSLIVGPNSELTIDEFVYNPDSENGELVMSATRGLLRFVGGALSKKDGNVKIKTPVGNLGIRGAVVLIDLTRSGGEVAAYLLYGNAVTGTTPKGTVLTAGKHGAGILLTPDGQIKKIQLTEDQFKVLAAGLRGAASTQTNSGGLGNLPDNDIRWMRELADQDRTDRMQSDDEEFNTSMDNMRIDELAS